MTNLGGYNFTANRIMTINSGCSGMRNCVYYKLYSCSCVLSVSIRSSVIQSLMLGPTN